MMRNIHFFDLKPGYTIEQFLESIREFEAYTLAHGCSERTTRKLHDAHSGGTPAEIQQYMNESLWPSVEAANATMAAIPEGIRTKVEAARAMGDNWKTVRYVD